MSSKPNPPAVERFALPGATVLKLAGPDATAFAQAQFSNDVATLPVGQWHWNAWLNPKGRVIALFRLAKLDTETLLLVLEDMAAFQIAERLVRYRFRSKVELESAAVRVEAQVQPAHSLEVGSVEQRGDETVLALDANRCLFLTPNPAEDPPDRHPQLAWWRLADVRAGIPHLADEDSEAFTAHMLGLDLLGALSLKKGCYPGHEIVARSHYLGQVKRSLRRVYASSALPARGSIADSDGRTIGQLISSANSDSGSEGLAVLPEGKSEDANQLQMNGVCVTPV